MTDTEHETGHDEQPERFPLENWYRKAGYDEDDLNVLDAAHRAMEAQKAAAEHDQ